MSWDSRDHHQLISCFEGKRGDEMLDLIWFLFDIFQFIYNELKYYKNKSKTNKKRPRKQRGHQKNKKT